jgi:DNA-binding NarL/FixJ family response regulator
VFFVARLCIDGLSYGSFGGEMVRARILLADDHTLVAEGFRKLLDPEFEIVGVVSDGRALLTLAVLTKPDVIVLDLGLPLLSGMEAGTELKRLLPLTRLIVVTMNEDPDLARLALRQWASAYLVKKSAGSELLKAVREVLKGRSYVAPRFEQRLMEGFIRDPQPHGPKQLTPRQREVLHLLAEGRTMRQTADLLHVTPRTVAFHKYRIMEEFGLKSNSDLVRFAIRERVISPT